MSLGRRQAEQKSMWLIYKCDRRMRVRHRRLYADRSRCGNNERYTALRAGGR